MRGESERCAVSDAESTRSRLSHRKGESRCVPPNIAWWGGVYQTAIRWMTRTRQAHYPAWSVNPVAIVVLRLERRLRGLRG